jgi:hypothetical protein
MLPQADSHTGNQPVDQPGRKMKLKLPDLIVLLIFLLSTGLRLGLASMNWQANDNHVQVVKLMLESPRLPTIDDCFECFQPKLFTYTVARVVELIGLTDLRPMRIAYVAQGINFAAGMIVMFLSWILIRRSRLGSEWLKVLVFGLLALNPQMIGINSQATNDTFAILFSSLAIFCTVLFFQQRKPVYFLLMVLFACLGIASKTNTWVSVVGISLSLLIQAIVERRAGVRRFLVALLFPLAVLALTLANPLTQYISNYRAYGRPMLLNINSLPLPPLVRKTVHNDRGGILSIKDGFFTFRFADLLAHPRLDYAHDGYPVSRTSFWTVLYASSHSAAYPFYPPSWTARAPQGHDLTRAIFILALLPTALLLAGFFLASYTSVKAVVLGDESLARSTGYGLFAILFIGYLAFAILYALLYQTFLVFKGIFIFPGWLAFAILMLTAGDRLWTLNSRLLKWSVAACLVTLMVSSAVEIITIIINISRYM